MSIPGSMVTTRPELPGFVVEKNLGVCFGLVVRSVGVAKSFTGGIRGLWAGEVPEYTQVLEDARRHAIDRMIDNGTLLGGNAILQVYFESSDVGQMFTEVVAYGTAVVVRER
jgi:uncharacterized protein YbjQ (UPF0145 family)